MKILNTLNKLISTVLVLIAVCAGVYLAFTTSQKIGASTVDGNDYQVKQITASNIGTTSIKSYAGAVGSIIISSSTPVATSGAIIAFYDVAPTTTATTSLTAKIKFGAEGAVVPTVGTYTFDASFGNGIYVWVNPSFNGNYTITYR